MSFGRDYCSWSCAIWALGVARTCPAVQPDFDALHRFIENGDGLRIVLVQCRRQDTYFDHLDRSGNFANLCRVCLYRRSSPETDQQIADAVFQIGVMQTMPAFQKLLQRAPTDGVIEFV